MLAYVFWHGPHDDSTGDAYEQAVSAFHHSLARSRPVGMRGSAVFRIEQLPWLAGEHAGSELAAAPARYEDWYLLDDYTALGVLNEAAVGRGHRSLHDNAARRSGAGTAGLYGLLEGDRSEIEGQAGGSCAGLLAAASCAVWVVPSQGTSERGLAELLGDGMDREHASLWRRQLVLGPAPEFCLLAVEAPAGAAATRLPAGWSARTVAREVLWHG